MLFALILLQFLTYLLMILISNWNATLLEVTMRPWWSIQMKLTVRSVLVLLKEQLRFAICLIGTNMNLFALSMLMRTMTCFLEGFLVIILIPGLGLSALPNIVLLISLIFLFKSSRKFSLIFKMLLMFLKDTWAYKGLSISIIFWFLSEVFLPWNLDFSRTFFDSLEES